MSRDRTNRIVTGLLVGTLVLALLVAACGGLRKALYTAGGGAAGAAVGSAAGPVGTIAGAGIGAGATVMVVENDELRSGELAGEGAQAALASESLTEWATRGIKRLVGFAFLVVVGWAALKLFLVRRGREGLAKEVAATPWSPLAWLRALLAADGVRHTRREP